MRNSPRLLQLFAGIAALCSAATAEAVTGIDMGYVALSAGGMDMMDDSERDSPIVLAQRPVIIGPVPESLVAAVFLPYRLESVMGGETAEANLSLASGLSGEIGEVDEDGGNTIRVNLSHFEAPADASPTKQQILEATLQAIQLTLQCAQNAQAGNYRFLLDRGDDIQVSTPLQFSVRTGDDPSKGHTCPAISTADLLGRQASPR